MPVLRSQWCLSLAKGVQNGAIGNGVWCLGSELFPWSSKAFARCLLGVGPTLGLNGKKKERKKKEGRKEGSLAT